MRKKMQKTSLMCDYSKLSEGSESQMSTLLSTQSSEQEVGGNLKDSRINLDPHDCRLVMVILFGLAEIKFCVIVFTKRI